MPFDPAPAAAALRQIRRERVLVSPLPAGIAPKTEAQGAEVQRALARMADAVPPFGFKIGATGRRMQAYLGVDAPIAGFMAGKDVYPGHADLRFADFIRPGVECEVAVRLARDLPPGACTLDQAIAAVGDFVAGIEIVENCYGDLKELGTPTLVADQMYHAAAVDRRPGQGQLAVAGYRRSGRLYQPERWNPGHRCYDGSSRPPAEWIGLARRLAGRRGVWWPEGRPGHHAGQRHPADLADRANHGDGDIYAAATGDRATVLTKS